MQESESKSGEIEYRKFRLTDGVENLEKMVEWELSEPYSIYLYRHFAIDYPELSIVATCDGQLVGCILGKFEETACHGLKGYIAMIVVDKAHRKKNIGKRLVELFIEECIKKGCEYTILETEAINHGALRLYESKSLFIEAVDSFG